jgi:hypothetical protein
MPNEPAVAPAAPSPAPPPAAPPAAPPASSGERIADAHYDRLSTTEQARYSRMKAPDGSGGEWRLRSDLGSDGKPTPAPATTSPSGSEQAQFKDGRLVLGEHELSADDVRQLFQERAARELRQSKVPASAEAYAPTLPPGLKLPEGVEVAIDGNDPAFKDLRNLAHARGWSQDDFSAALGINATKQAGEAAALRTAINAEIAKLGANGSQRISALQTWFRSAVGDDLAKSLSQALITAKSVEAFERLAARDMSGGAASFSQAHREPASGNGRVSDEEYARMSPAQRWAYSRQFDQKQFK